MEQWWPGWTPRVHLVVVGSRAESLSEVQIAMQPACPPPARPRSHASHDGGGFESSLPKGPFFKLDHHLITDVDIKEFFMDAIAATQGARLGHVHLKVSDLERAIAFYRDVLRMQVMTLYGRQAAFLSYDGYHHHLGLNTWESEGAPPPPPFTSGLYHLALLYPTREALATIVSNVLKAGHELDGASDHGVSQAVYLRDPDQNGVELYWDRPAAEWPRDAQGEIVMVTDPLDLEGLLATVVS